MPCLMKTWSRLSSVICGRNECRLKRVTRGGPAPPAQLSQQQSSKQTPGGAIGGGSIVPTADSWLPVKFVGRSDAKKPWSARIGAISQLAQRITRSIGRMREKAQFL